MRCNFTAVARSNFNFRNTADKHQQFNSFLFYKFKNEQFKSDT